MRAIALASAMFVMLATFPVVSATTCIATVCATAQGNHSGQQGPFGSGVWSTFRVHGYGTHSGSGIPGQGTLSTSAGGSDTCILSVTAFSCTTSTTSPTLNNIPYGFSYTVNANTVAGVFVTDAHHGTA